MEVIKELEQGSPEWHDARRCKVTGTKLKNVMGTPYARFELACELIAEEGTEQSDILRPTTEMERGTAEEEFAIKLFEKQTGKTVEQVGMCISSEYEWLTLSPDGLIKKDGKYSEAIEVKSPKSKTVIRYKLSNLVDHKELGLTPAKKPFLGVPADYKWQCVDYFLVNPDLRTLYFVWYDERFIDGELKLNIVELKWENEILQDAIHEARTALEDFRKKWVKWRSLALPDNF
jgi:hypothetical protein